jgi:hypothetical protein
MKGKFGIRFKVLKMNWDCGACLERKAYTIVAVNLTVQHAFRCLKFTSLLIFIQIFTATNKNLPLRIPKAGRIQLCPHNQRT